MGFITHLEILKSNLLVILFLQVEHLTKVQWLLRTGQFPIQREALHLGLRVVDFLMYMVDL